MLCSHTSMGALGRSVTLLALVVFMGATAGVAEEVAPAAQSDSWTPIQLKLARDLALFSNETSVYGIRLGVVEDWPFFQGDSPRRASNIVGLDISLGNANPHRMRGIQFSGGGAASGDITGIAVGGGHAGGDHVKGMAIGGWFAYGEHVTGIIVGGWSAGCGFANGGKILTEDMTGMAIGGLFTTCGDMAGLQLAGVVNHAKTVKGVQIGIVNLCQELNGVQVGLLNRVGGRTRWPIINAQF